MWVLGNRTDAVQPFDWWEGKHHNTSKIKLIKLVIACCSCVVTLVLLLKCLSLLFLWLFLDYLNAWFNHLWCRNLHWFRPCWDRNTVNYMNTITESGKWNVRGLKRSCFNDKRGCCQLYYLNLTSIIQQHQLFHALLPCTLVHLLLLVFKAANEHEFWPDLMVLFTLWPCLPRAFPCALTPTGLTDEHRDRRRPRSVRGWPGWRWGSTIYHWTKSDSVQKAQRTESKVSIEPPEIGSLILVQMKCFHFNSDLKPSEDPDEIFKAIKEGKFIMSRNTQVIIYIAKHSDIHCLNIQAMKMHWTEWQCSRRLFPEWTDEDGSQCTRLQCKRIKRYLNLSSQVSTAVPFDSLKTPVCQLVVVSCFSISPWCSPVSHAEGWDPLLSGCGSWTQRECYVFITERL